ncbi:MAG: ATP-binding cassette domain-containing protein [Limisphaerales bacterium]
MGQQLRLCLARTLAVDPEVILLDEPTSALDPKSTEAIEEMLLRLKVQRTLVLVTHNLAQAQRVCDHAACLLVREDSGVLAASDTVGALFNQSQPPDVAAYLRKGD